MAGYAVGEPWLCTVEFRDAEGSPGGSSRHSPAAGGGPWAWPSTARTSRATRRAPPGKRDGPDRYLLPTGHGMVYASAVFLHFTSDELAAVLVRLAEAVEPGGWLAFTVKEGDGQAWSTEKIGQRFFQYWREPPLRTLLAGSPWTLVSLTGRRGLKDTWLSCLCRLDIPSRGNSTYRSRNLPRTTTSPSS